MARFWSAGMISVPKSRFFIRWRAYLISCMPNLAVGNRNDKLVSMTRVQVLAWSIVLILTGGGVLGYLLQGVPPTLPTGQWNLPVITCFIAALAGLVSGIGALSALLLHQRWPALAGAPRHKASHPETALRQGLLLGIATTAISLFALLRTLDITFILVTLLLLGLVEAYLQNRQTK